MVSKFYGGVRKHNKGTNFYARGTKKLSRVRIVSIMSP